MEGGVFVIRDGVRRAKAAWMLGHVDIWARVDGETADRKLPIESLRSPKLAIDTAEKGGKRWANVLDGMSHEPDLIESITVVPGDIGIPIRDVRVLEPNR